MTLGAELEIYNVERTPPIRLEMMALGWHRQLFVAEERSAGKYKRKGAEINTRPCDSVEQLLDALDKAIFLAKKFNAMLTPTCGFHIHVGLTREDVCPNRKKDIPIDMYSGRIVLAGAAIALWIQKGDERQMLEKVYGPDWENHPVWQARQKFCAPLTEADIVSAMIGYGSRYRTLNILDEHASAEFRLFPASLELARLEAYVRWTLEWVNKAIAWFNSYEYFDGCDNGIVCWLSSITELADAMRREVRARMPRFQDILWRTGIDLLDVNIKGGHSWAPVRVRPFIDPDTVSFYPKY
jgi:hypothetical protein